MPDSVYSPSAGRHDAVDAVVCKLNVGDTWLQPFTGGRMEDLSAESFPDLHRYSATQGIPPLIDAIVEKVRDRNRAPCERDSVLVCAGATSALSCATGMLAAPAEEVLILAPFWPLIRSSAALAPQRGSLRVDTVEPNRPRHSGELATRTR
jgi:N-succinyldiaminopimelate aminotransferase